MDRSKLAGKLVAARNGMRLSTRAVAERLAPEHHVSHATIANYEKGRSVPPHAILVALAAIYERSLDWFLAAGPSLEGVRYRNLKSKVKVSDRAWYESLAQKWLEAYQRVETYLGNSLATDAKPISISQESSDLEIAASLRQAFEIGDEAPVESVISCLERLAVRTIELPTDLAIDGFAARFGSEYAVVLNSNTSNDRCRMDAAHEMCHVILGDCDSDSAETKEVEQRAFRIASYFLLPPSQLDAAFKGKSLVKMVQYKERFGISLAAMVYRAQESKLITSHEATWLWREFSMRGWRKNEPGYVRPDRAIRFEDMLDSAITQKRMTWQLAESITGINQEELRQRLVLAMGIAAVEGGNGPQSPTVKMFAE